MPVCCISVRKEEPLVLYPNEPVHASALDRGPRCRSGFLHFNPAPSSVLGFGAELWWIAVSALGLSRGHSGPRTYNGLYLVTQRYPLRGRCSVVRESSFPPMSVVAWVIAVNLMVRDGLGMVVGVGGGNIYLDRHRYSGTATHIGSDRRRELVGVRDARTGGVESSEALGWPRWLVGVLSAVNILANPVHRNRDPVR